MKADAITRARLRRIGVDESVLMLYARSQHAKRPTWAPWPRCTGTTKIGERCRRGAICNRQTRQPLGEQPRCRWHADQSVWDALQQIAARLSAGIDRYLEDNRDRPAVYPKFKKEKE